MKAYLVSEIIAYPDERMQKKFELFKSKEDAIEYLQWKKEELVNDIAEHYDYDESEDGDIEDYLMDYIETIQAEHHGEISYDEHVWTSLRNTGIISQIICDVLCEINPDAKDKYISNTEIFINELNDLDTQFKDVIESSDKTVVFSIRAVPLPMSLIP